MWPGWGSNSPPLNLQSDVLPSPAGVKVGVYALFRTNAYSPYNTRGIAQACLCSCKSNTKSKNNYKSMSGYSFLPFFSFVLPCFVAIVLGGPGSKGVL